MSMWDTLDRLINKPQPAKLAQISSALGSYRESPQGMGGTNDFSLWLHSVEGINLGAFMKTGIVTAWDAEGFITEQFRKFALERPEAFDRLRKQLEKLSKASTKEASTLFPCCLSPSS